MGSTDHAMRNCLVLGAGRSGTSLAAGLLADSGYFLGDDLFAGTPGNPTGLFESETVNSLNEELIAQLVRVRPRIPWTGGRDVLGGARSRWVPGLNRWPGRRQLWLASVPPDAPDPIPRPEQRAVMERLTLHQPWCFKDPRLSYTLGAWRDVVPAGTVYLCLFRDPGTVVTSVMREVADAPYLRNLRMTPTWALDVWVSIYTHIVRRHARSGEWLFVHYEQLLDGTGIDRIAETLDVRLDASRVDQRLRRSTPGATSVAAEALYDDLCRLARFSPAERNATA